MGLKALCWFQSWSEDEGLSYQQNAKEMYDIMEQTIVNSQLPEKYKQDLISKQKFLEHVKSKEYPDYRGMTSTIKDCKSSVSSDTPNTKIEPLPKGEKNENKKYIIDSVELLDEESFRKAEVEKHLNEMFDQF